MNPTTLFLAKVIGPMLALIGLGILINPKYYYKIYKNFEIESFSVMLATMILIVAGSALVTKHFLWGSLAEILISIIGVAILFKGAFIALVPQVFKKLSNKVLSLGIIKFGGLLWAIGGGYLMFIGFGL